MSRTIFMSCAVAAAFAGASAAAEPHTFEFWYGLRGQLGEVVEQLCADYNAAQEDYAVACRLIPGYEALFQAGIAAYRSGTHPVLMQADSPYTGTLMLSGAVKPAFELMAEQGYEVDWDDFIAPIRNMYADTQGRMWSYPFNTSTDMLWTNMDLYRQAGLETPPATWEEFEENLRTLEAAGIACPYAFEFQWYVQLTQFSATNDIPLATRANGYEGLDAELVVDETTFAKHVANLKRWVDEGLAPVYGGDTRGSGGDAFIRGECAHMTRSISGHANVQANAGFDWEVSRLPVYAENTPTNSIAGGASLWAMAGKDDADYAAAADFLDWLTSEAQIEFWVTNTGYVPIRTSVFEALKARGFYDDPQFAGREKAVESLTFTPVTENSKGFRLGNFAQIISAWNEEMENVISGAKSPEEGVADFVTRGNQALARFAQAYPGQTLP